MATVAATLVNPYGIGLWYFLGETVRLGRADITEWNPLLALPPLILVFETILPIVAVVAIRQARWRVPWTDAAMVLLLVAAAFKVGRLDAFAQAALAILLAPGILAGLEAFGSKLNAPFWRAHLPGGAWVAVGLVTLVLVVGGRRLTRIVVEGPWIPDKDAAMFLRARAPGARVLTWFDWGEYAIWQLAPVGIRVSIDGRRETVYSSNVVARHNGFYEAHAGDLDYAERIGADTVWLPVNAPVIATLRGRGWHVAFESARSVVLTRAATETSRATTLSEGARIFPWP
jgi:hypothetical protein